MVVLSSVLAISVLLMHVKADVHKIALENVTHIVSGSFYPPTVLKLRNHLVYVSYLKEYDNIYMKIESSEILNNSNRSCEATIFVPSERQFSPPVTKILGNEKLIVAFVEKDPDNTEGYKKLDDPVENYTEPIVRFNIIDFYDNCSFVNFTDQFDNGVLESYVPFTIVPYQDSFDILAKSGLHCKTNGSLCVIRYGDKGYKEMVRELDFDTVGINPAFESLHSLYEFDSTDGYVYASAQKLKLLKLDSNLKTVKEYSFKDSLLLALSILNGDVGLCVRPESDSDGFAFAEPQTQCRKLDSRLKLKESVNLNTLYHYGATRLYNLRNEARGSSLVVTAIRTPKQTTLIIRKLNGKNGKLSRAEQYVFECGGLDIVDERADNFIEIKPGLYCFSFMCGQSRLVTHCLPASEATNLNSYANS